MQKPNPDDIQFPLKHGGNLATVIQQSDIPKTDWIDLSTGISPWSWPVPELSKSIWHQLPSCQTELIDIARQYYRCNANCQLVATMGSQLAIRLLPQIIKAKIDDSQPHVAIPWPGYEEHALSWKLAGFSLHFYHNANELAQLIDKQQVNHAVIINPNNPTAEAITAATLITIREKLAPTGYLIIDEAFADCRAKNSLASLLPLKRTLVLRSMGKFFGLAGVRIGFVLGNDPVVRQLQTLLEPWGIHAAGIEIAQGALADIAWHSLQQQRIAEQSTTFLRLISSTFEPRSIHNAGLFITLIDDLERTEILFKEFAQHGILLRHIHHHKSSSGWLRFGLPGEKGAQVQQLLKKW